MFDAEKRKEDEKVECDNSPADADLEIPNAESKVVNSSKKKRLEKAPSQEVPKTYGYHLRKRSRGSRLRHLFLTMMAQSFQPRSLVSSSLTNTSTAAESV